MADCGHLARIETVGTGRQAKSRPRTTQGHARPRKMERAMGIEPTAQAWEAWVLPLYDDRLRSIVVPCSCERQQPAHASKICPCWQVLARRRAARRAEPVN